MIVYWNLASQHLLSHTWNTQRWVAWGKVIWSNKALGPGSHDHKLARSQDAVITMASIVGPASDFLARVIRISVIPWTDIIGIMLSIMQGFSDLLVSFWLEPNRRPCLLVYQYVSSDIIFHETESHKQYSALNCWSSQDSKESQSWQCDSWFVAEKLNWLKSKWWCSLLITWWIQLKHS